MLKSRARTSHVGLKPEALATLPTDPHYRRYTADTRRRRSARYLPGACTTCAVDMAWALCSGVTVAEVYRVEKYFWMSSTGVYEAQRLILKVLT